MIDIDDIKNRLAAVHAAGASGITVRLEHSIRVIVQMQSWEGNTAHEANAAVTHLLGHAPADLTALVAEVERLRAEVERLRYLLKMASGVELRGLATGFVFSQGGDLYAHKFRHEFSDTSVCATDPAGLISLCEKKTSLAPTALT